ncbi:MAG: hypothetical protein JSW07_22540 [bacterium]|nr:MAG: hypothetical protein JSW07_22540 [bacterium]
MGDLITILIILVAIISFLNKIFGQQKRQQTTRQQPAPKPKQVEWVPPWLDPEEIEPPVRESELEQLDVVDEIKYKKPLTEGYDKKKEAPTVITVPAKKIEPIIPKKTIDTYQVTLKRFEAFNVDLSSRGEVRRGIVLAEILGPCRARRNLRRM